MCWLVLTSQTLLWYWTNCWYYWDNYKIITTNHYQLRLSYSVKDMEVVTRIQLELYHYNLQMYSRDQKRGGNIQVHNNVKSLVKGKNPKENANKQQITFIDVNMYNIFQLFLFNLFFDYYVVSRIKTSFYCDVATYNTHIYLKCSGKFMVV